MFYILSEFNVAFMIALIFAVNIEPDTTRHQKSLLKRNLIQKENRALALDVVIDFVFDGLYAVRQEEFVVPEVDVAVSSLHFVVFVGCVDRV